MIPSSGQFQDGVHHFPLRVYYEDTDAGGIVYHSVYLQYAERARTEMLRLAGFDQTDLLVQEGVMVVVRRCTLSYEKPARLDDALVIKSRLDVPSGARMHFTQDIYRGDTLLVRVTAEVAFCTPQGRPTRAPKRLMEKF